MAPKLGRHVSKISGQLQSPWIVLFLGLKIDVRRAGETTRTVAVKRFCNQNQLLTTLREVTVNDTLPTR